MKTRMHAVEITIDCELNISYRLALPVKQEHIHLFDDHKRILSYVRNGKIRYMYVVESNDKTVILTAMRAAQLIINDQKIKELQQRSEALLYSLSN